MADDLDPLEQHLVDALRALAGPGRRVPARPRRRRPRGARRSTAALIDHAARWLQAQKLGFYTIGSAGHESNALVALALRPDRPGAAALPLRRLLPRPCRPGRATTASRDVLLGMAAAADEPIAGGRHKVFGHHDARRDPADVDDRLAPAARRRRRLRDRAGARASASPSRVARRRRRRLLASATRRSTTRPRSRRSTRRRTSRYRGAAAARSCFVCEDNGLGISVPTPEGWVEQSLDGRPELAYERADGDDPAALLATAQELAALGARAPASRPCSTCAPCAT